MSLPRHIPTLKPKGGGGGLGHGTYDQTFAMAPAKKTGAGRVEHLENIIAYCDLIPSPSELKTIGVCRDMDGNYAESFTRIRTELKTSGNLRIEDQPIKKCTANASLCIKQTGERVC